MIGLFPKILPVYLIFLAGLVLKWTKILKQQDGDFLLKIIFYFTLPALILKSLPGVTFHVGLIWLPLSSAIIIIFSGLLAWLTSRILHLSSIKAGVLFSASMIMNIGFTIPFIFATFGDHGLAYLFIFDFTNGILAYSLVYFIACRHGENSHNSRIVYKKLLLSPPVWALVSAITLNFTGLSLPIFFMSFLDISGQMTIPLFLLALSLYFSPEFSEILHLLAGIAIRMFAGFLAGMALVLLLPVDPLAKLIIITGASAPVGFNTLTFSSLEKLDVRYAANLVSLSILIGMVSVPFLIWIFA